MFKFKIHKYLTITTVFILLNSGNAIAGSWAKGYGSTVEEATENAIANAKSAISSRGAGCLSGQIKLLGKEHDLWAVEAHYNQHNGSCGHGGGRDYNWVNDPCKLNDLLPVCEE